MKLKSIRCSATAAEPPLISAEEMIPASLTAHQPLEGCIEAIIARGGGAGVTKSEVIRRTQFADRRHRNKALVALIRAGRIVAIKQPTATKPTIVLRSAANCDRAVDPEAMVPSPVNGPPIEALAGGRPMPPVILALDLGQRTGWAVRSRDGAIASGVQEFRPGRFEGGGMIWLRFRAWLQEVDETAGGVGVVVFEEVRRHLGTSAGHIYGGYLAHLTAWAEANKIPYQGVPEVWASQNGAVLAALIRALDRAAAWADDPVNCHELATLLAAPEYLGMPEGVVARALCGEILTGSGLEHRAVADFLVLHRNGANLPSVEHALWIYSQMVRWRQAVRRPGDEAVIRSIFRPDVYRAALAGAAWGPDTMADGPGIEASDELDLFDHRPFDPTNIDAYLA